MRPKFVLRHLLPCFFFFTGSLLAEIPASPPTGYWLHDYANVLSAKDKATLQERQRIIYKQTGAPIVVVTINSMSGYLPGATDIDQFARLWFDRWGIGSVSNNTGILILLSTGDRKVRIELGADWGRRWDRLAKRIIDDRMVPHFKTTSYKTGLIAGFDALARMAVDGPQAIPLDETVADKAMDLSLLKFTRENNPLVAKLGSLTPYALGLGILITVSGFLLPGYRIKLIAVGLSLVGLVLFFWVTVVLIVLYLIFNDRSRRNDNWDSWNNRWDSGSSYWGNSWGGSSGSGGSGSGSSGGGGASGSW